MIGTEVNAEHARAVGHTRPFTQSTGPSLYILFGYRTRESLPVSYHIVLRLRYLTLSVWQAGSPPTCNPVSLPVFHPSLQRNKQ